MSTNFCLRHHDRPATARCHACHKPLCDECIVRAEGGEFCSVACQANHQRFYARFQSERPPGLFARLKRFALNLAILAALLAGGVLAGAKIFHWEFCLQILRRLGG